MNKINKVIKYEDLPSDALRALRAKYPDGWKDYVRKITKPNGEFFYSISVDTETVSYLVKVNVKIDSKTDAEKLDYSYNDDIAAKEEDEAEDEDTVYDEIEEITAE